MPQKYNVVDLFSGCGGFSYGFEEAGFDAIVGVDFDQSALNTYKLNHKNSSALNLDLSEEAAIDEIVKEVGDRKVDVIIAGPPCQGFSLTGPRDENDKRNKLFYSVFKLAEKLKPAFIVIENVPGLAHLYHGRARAAIISEFTRLEYSVSEQLMYAPDYGVPQIRKRMVFIGTKKDQFAEPFKFPHPTHNAENYVTCEEAISDLPPRINELGFEKDSYTAPPVSKYQKLMRGKCTALHNHVATHHTDLVKSVISQVPEGGNYKDLPPGVGESRRFNEAWTRYHSKKPSRTIDTGHRNHFHYKWNRVPTIRENARLQSFPDEFIFIGTKTQQNKQVGNAVPPLLGYIIGKALKKMLEKRGADLV